MCVSTITVACQSVCVVARCRMKAYLETSVSVKSSDYDDMQLIFDKSIYRSGQQVLPCQTVFFSGFCFTLITKTFKRKLKTFLFQQAYH